MRSSVTLNEIAEALGISRNTVSRVLNGRDVVSQKTQKRVIETAKSMGYGNIPVFKNITPDEPKNNNHYTIAFVTRINMGASYFFSSIISAVENYLSSRNCTLSFINVRPGDFKLSSLPVTLKKCDGIICADIFNPGYLSALFASGIPVVLIETYWDMFKFGTPHTVILMENEKNVETLTSSLISRGHKNIAFVGNPKYCRGYYERHRGYLMAHVNEGRLPLRELQLFNFDASSVDSAENEIKFLKIKPTAYICAGDAQAIMILMALAKMGVRVPDEVEVLGFDDLPQSEMVTPALTTVHTFTSQLGKRAACAILERISNPGFPNEIIYLPTAIKYRSSTRNTKEINT